MGDTPADVARRYRVMLAARTPGEKLAMASRMFATARRLVLSGIKGKEFEPGVRKSLFLKFYERDFSAAERDRILEYLNG